LKNKVMRLAVVAVAAILTATLALPVLAAGDVTVGQFIQRLALQKSLNATTPEIAAESLAAVGLRLPADVQFSAGLKERDVTAIARSLGLRLTTSRPDASFTSEQVDEFIATFGLDLGQAPGDEGNSTRNGATPGGESGGAPGNGPAFDPYSKGKGGSKGKKKGHRSSTEPE